MPRKPGRPKLPRADNLDENQGGGGLVANYRGVRHNIQMNLMNRVRERIDPDLFIDSLITIMQGHVPLWIDDKRATCGVRVIPDPNPLLPSPTLQQRLDAQRELMNRGWGQAPQHVKFDVTHQEQLPLAGVDLELLAEVQKLLLKAGKPQITNIVDAELVEDSGANELQEPCQVETPNDLLENSELQEPCQVTEATNLPTEVELQDSCQSHGGAKKLQNLVGDVANLGAAIAAVAEIIVSTNENSPPEGDSSGP